MADELIMVAAKIPAKLYERLDRYWHAKRLPTRSAAIREAIERLVEQDKRPAPKAAE